jgi:hypothetical protein
MGTESAVAPAAAQRVKTARIAAWFLAGVSAVLLFGIVDLLTLPGWADQRYVWQVPLDASWGCLFTFVLAGAYAWIGLRPRRPWPGIVQLAVAGASLLAAGALGLDGRPAVVGLAVVGSAVLFAWLVGGTAGPVPRINGPHWTFGVLAAAGIPLWLSYAAFSSEKARVLGDDAEGAVISAGLEHWPFQAALGLALGVCGVVMALWATGRPLMRLSVSVSAAYVGAAMLAYPDRGGAMPGPLWGVAMVLWGVLIALPLPTVGGTPGEAGSGRETKNTPAS